MVPYLDLDFYLAARGAPADVRFNRALEDFFATGLEQGLSPHPLIDIERFAAGKSHGERLRIIDPGIVPERPSSPNIPLNVLIAFVAAAFLSLVYLGLAFQSRPSLVRAAMRSTANG